MDTATKVRETETEVLESVGREKRLSDCTETEVNDEGHSQCKVRRMFPIFQPNFKPQPNPLKDIQLAFAESSKASSVKRPRRSLLGKTETRGMNQLIIDAGQKQIGPRFCTDCGLLYSPGDFEDEEEHRKAHNRLQNLFTLRLWKDARVLQTFIDSGFVIMVNGSGDPKAMKRLEDFMAWVDSELGVGSGSTGSSPSQRIFIYVLPTTRKNVIRILGYAVMEVIEPNAVLAYRLRPPPEKHEDNEDSATDRTSYSSNQTVTEVSSILVGITRLWTDSSFRKKKIASRLCDMIRFHSGIPGYIITYDQLGILEPSESGKAFMHRYTQGKGALYTYKLVSEIGN